MIKVFVRYVDDPDGVLFTKVSTIGEIKDVEEYFKSTPIIDDHGNTFSYSCAQIEFNDEITIEILLDV